MPTPRHIGRYRLEQVIGTGGFATVHRAVDERLDDTVAVKVLADNHSLDPDIRERFLSEGRILRRIDSHHVATHTTTAEMKHAAITNCRAVVI